MSRRQLDTTLSDDDSLSVARHLAPAGALANAYEILWESIWTQRYIPADIIELCRLRIAELLGAGAELQPGTGMSRQLSAPERAALELAELHAIDPAMITDSVTDEVKRHFGESGLVALIEAVGFIDGRIRLSLLLPKLLRETSSVTD